MKYLNLGCGNHFHPEWTNIDFTVTGPGVIAHNLLNGLPFENCSFDLVYHSHLLEHFTKPQAKVFMGECYRVLQPGGIIRVAVPNLEQICRSYLEALERADNRELEWQDNYEWIMLEMFDQCVRNQSGGEILKYLMQDPIPNQVFLANRLGAYYESLMQGINSYKQNLLRNPARVEVALTDTEIGKFRNSGEIHQWMYDRYSLRILLENTGFKDIVLRTAHESYFQNWSSFCLDTDADGVVYKADSLYMEGIK